MAGRKVESQLYYKIGEACRVLDIQPYVLRYWETEFAALSPSKSRSGQRVYSEKEIAIIRRIKQLLYEEGFTIAGAKKKLETELAAGTLGEEGAAAPGPAPVVAGSGPGGKSAPKPAAAPVVKPVVQRVTVEEREPDAPLATIAADFLLDTRPDERIQHVRQGLEAALREAREILALLESPSR